MGTVSWEREGEAVPRLGKNLTRGPRLSGEREENGSGKELGR
jgi:hypothetical protein